mmetsp:Transcript_92805/g.271665  ORF Transcript_92805/g.271665 Transcript_92805/m.271665 type:complete len:237 (-) Transcript_92805:354-1064(-)
MDFRREAGSRRVRTGVHAPVPFYTLSRPRRPVPVLWPPPSRQVPLKRPLYTLQECTASKMRLNCIAGIATSIFIAIQIDFYKKEGSSALLKAHFRELRDAATMAPSRTPMARPTNITPSMWPSWGKRPMRTPKTPSKGITKLSSSPMTSASTSPSVTRADVTMATSADSPAKAARPAHTRKHPMLPSTFREEDPTGIVPAAVPMDAAASPTDRKRMLRIATWLGAASMAAKVPGRK